MRVWIDQDHCQNSGLCEVTVPDTFGIGDDDLAYVRQDGRLLGSPGGSGAVAAVPPALEDAVAEAARECPGQCIHLIDE
jgi:ferredoxin